MTISAKSLGDNDLRGLCIFLNRPNLFNINDLGTLLAYVCICTCVYVRVCGGTSHERVSCVLGYPLRDTS